MQQRSCKEVGTPSGFRADPARPEYSVGCPERGHNWRINRDYEQLREAFPFEQVPRYLLRDRDAIVIEEHRREVPQSAR